MFVVNYTASTEIYTLSLHDALPISGRLDQRLERAAQPVLLPRPCTHVRDDGQQVRAIVGGGGHPRLLSARSEEHTSELQSRQYLVCRLLLEKKNIHKYLSLSRH